MSKTALFHHIRYIFIYIYIWYTKSDIFMQEMMQAVLKIEFLKGGTLCMRNLG